MGWKDAPVVAEPSWKSAPEVKSKDAEGPARGTDDKVAYRRPEKFKGFNPQAQAAYEAKIGTDKPTQLNLDESLAGAATRGLVRSAAPTIGGFGGAAAGAGVGALFGPLAPVTVPVGAIIGGIGGGMGLSALQEEALKAKPEFAASIGQSPEQRRMDLEKHPLASLAAEYGPGFLFGRPSLAAGKVAENAGRVTRALANPAVGNVALGTFGGGLEALRESTSGEQIDPAKVAIAAGLTAAQRKSWGLGNMGAAALSPLDEAILKSKGSRTNEAGQIAADLAEAGVPARPYEVLDKGAKANVHTGMGINPKAADIAEKYAEAVQAETPSVGQRVVSNLAPTDVRTAEQAAEQAAKDIAEHPDVVAAKPDVVSGEAGSKIHEKFNADLDAREAEMSKTYKEAESGGKTVISPTVATPADLSKRMKEAFEPHAEIFGDIDIPASSRRFTSISKFLSDAKELDVGQVFKIRAQLNSVIGGKPGSPDARAAKDMKKALDDFMDEVVSKPDSLVGDADTASKWRSAIEQRREIGKLYGANDVFQDITEREWSGGKKIPKMSVFNAGERLLGNMSGARGQVQDLINLRDRLGANSPEWIALQKEGLAKVLGKDFGTKKFGTALAKFEADKPELAKLFITPEDRVRLTAGQDVVQGAVSRTDAQKVGTGIIGTNATDFANSVSTMSNAARRDARVAGRQRFRDFMNRPKQSAAMLEEIATGSDTQANIRSLFDPDEAEQIIRSAKAVSKRFEQAGAIKPPAPEAAGREDENVLGAATAAIAGAKIAPAIQGVKFLTRLLGDKKKAEALVRDAFDPNKTADVVKFIEKNHGNTAAQNFGKLIAGQVSKRENLIRNTSRVVGVMGSEPSEFNEPDKAADTNSEPQAATADLPDIDYWADLIGDHEGTGKNPTSSAVGPFQFVSGTLAEVYNDTHEGANITPEEAEAMRADGRISADDLTAMGRHYTQKNVGRLMDGGYEVTPGNVYLMHFAGPYGAPKVLDAEVDAPITSLLDAGAISANSNIEFNGKKFPDFTAQDLRDWADNVMVESDKRYRERVNQTD